MKKNNIKVMGVKDQSVSEYFGPPLPKPGFFTRLHWWLRQISEAIMDFPGSY